MMLHVCFLLAAVLLLPRSAAAQETELPLSRALEIARARAPQYAAIAGRRQAATGRAHAEAAFGNPVVEWRYENADSPLARDIFATVTVPFDPLLRRGALRSAARATERRASADSAALVRQADATVARAYWHAALARTLREAAAEERVAREALARYDDDRAREGAIAELAAMRNRLEVERARVAEALAVSGEARALADFARAIGVPVDSVPRPAPLTLPPLVDAPAPATALASAQQSHPELLAAREAVSEAQRRVDAENRGVIPEMQLVAGSKQTGGYDTWLYGVMAPIPLLNRNQGARERSRGELAIARAELRDAENRIAADVTSAIAAYEALRAGIGPEGPDIAGRGAEIARLTEAAYREGGATLLDVLESQRARAESRVIAARRALDLHLARLALHLATGAPILESP
jgi:cobalt-zinc-cadmium efflux system outer membrane protein